MKDNLSEMISGLENGSGFPSNQKDLDITIEDNKEPKVEKLNEVKCGDTEILRKEETKISLCSFPSWFENNTETFDNVRQIKLSVRGIDPKKNLVFSVQDPMGGKAEDGYDKRNLFLFKDADQYVVLNLETVSLDIFNNGFKIVYKTGNENIFLKCYGVKTGLIVVNCININGTLIPYYRHKIKKKDKELTNIIVNRSKLESVLKENADLESLQILYRQLIKIAHRITTNRDMVNWFYNRQKSITDINHHLQIDSVLITLLTSAMESN